MSKGHRRLVSKKKNHKYWKYIHSCDIVFPSLYFEFPQKCVWVCRHWMEWKHISIFLMYSRQKLYYQSLSPIFCDGESDSFVWLRWWHCLLRKKCIMGATFYARVSLQKHNYWCVTVHVLNWCLAAFLQEMCPFNISHSDFIIPWCETLNDSLHNIFLKCD